MTSLYAAFLWLFSLLGVTPGLCPVDGSDAHSMSCQERNQAAKATYSEDGCGSDGPPTWSPSLHVDGSGSAEPISNGF